MNEFSYQEQHMGTNVSLSFVCEEASIANAIASKVFDLIHDYELRFSRFLPESELSQLNQKGALSVSSEFIAVLKKSMELFFATNGAFNPLLQVRTLGYTNTFPAIKDTVATLAPITYNTELQTIRIDYTTNNVTLQSNQQLDFGGLLKGYLSTKIANEINVLYPHCTGLIINIGGDIATRGLDNFNKPFIFELYNPITGEEITTVLTNSALATSGTYARTWQTNSGPRHHIVDTASLDNPKQKLVATSIIHHDGATAEALTKLFLVAGVAKAIKQVPPMQNHYQYFSVFTDGKIATNLI